MASGSFEFSPWTLRKHPKRKHEAGCSKEGALTGKLISTCWSPWLLLHKLQQTFSQPDRCESINVYGKDTNILRGSAPIGHDLASIQPLSTPFRQLLTIFQGHTAQSIRIPAAGGLLLYPPGIARVKSGAAGGQGRRSRACRTKGMIGLCERRTPFDTPVCSSK